MKVKGLKETVVKRNGSKKEYVWAVKQISEKEYKCIELDFTFNIESGITSKKRNGEQIILNQPFKSGSRQITYTLVTEKDNEVNEENNANKEKEV